MPRILLLQLVLLLLPALATVAAPPALKVSDNHRYLVTADGKPFFYLGDTAWESFHRLNAEEADAYLRNRAEKGFTVIQAVVLAEEDGLHAPNANGDLPLVNDDPAKPNEKYFAHVDAIVKRAGELGLFIGMLPTWGDKWNLGGRAGPEIFTPDNAGPYGKWIASRYKDAPNVIWILGGDRRVENDRHKQIIRAMAEGIRAGDGGSHLITFHPRGGGTSADPFHAEAWLDFNMRQNGHGIEYNGRYDLTRVDYDRTPVKPVLDGEPVYEDHPVGFNAKEKGHSIAADCRRALYWDLFSGGACGHTYGNHAVWQMFDPAKGRKAVNNPLMPWRQAIDQPGAGQMQHAKHLLLSRPYLSRVPDDSILVPANPPTLVPGAGTRRFAATRDADGSYAMVYFPIGRPATVRTEVVKADQLRAWWFDPRSGQATEIGILAQAGTREFTPPTAGEATDWVLVIDDASKSFGEPGKR